MGVLGRRHSINGQKDSGKCVIKGAREQLGKQCTGSASSPSMQKTTQQDSGNLVAPALRLGSHLALVAGENFVQ